MKTLRFTVSATALTVALGFALASDMPIPSGELGASILLTQALGTGTADITISESYTETASGTGDVAIDGKVISPGIAFLDVTGWSGPWDATGVVLGTDYDSRLHDIEYYWTVPTKPGGADYSTRPEVNLPSTPAAFRDMSIQRGPSVAIPLPVAGTYTIRCFAVEVSSGETCTKDITITTVSEDAAFPGTRTICYSPDGTFTGKPTSAQEVTTKANLQTEITNRTSTTYRICLRKGETYAGTDIGFSYPTSFPNFRSSTYGTGDDPLVTAPFSGSLFSFPSGGGTKHVWIGPIWWQGRWDTVNERGHADTWQLASITNATGTVTYGGARVTGISILTGLPLQDNTKTCLYDCDMSDFKSWGAATFVDDADKPTNNAVCMIGTRFGCVPGFVEGRTGRTGTGEFENALVNAESAGWIIRLQGQSKVVFQHSFFMGAMVSGSVPQRQIRMEFIGLTNWAYNCFEGAGAGGFVDFAGSPDLDRSPCNIIVDANLWFPTGHPSTAAPLVFDVTGVTVRNNYQWVGVTRSGNGIEFMDGGNRTGSGAEANVPFMAYNNHRYDAVSRFQPDIIRNVSFTTNTVANNWARSTGASDITVSSAISGYTASFAGRKLGFPTIQITLGGTWNQTQTFDILFSNALLNELDGTPTTQTYWNTTVAAGDTKHMVRLADGTLLYAEDGDFSMTVLTDRLRFTNDAAGNISAQTIHVKVDRASELTLDTTYKVDAAATPAYAKIASGSAASFEITPSTWSSNPYSDRDLEDTRRGATPYTGAIEA